MTNPIPRNQVVHLDFISLAGTATESAIQDLIQAAASLNELPSVQLVGMIRAGQHPGLNPTAADEPDYLRAEPPLSRGGMVSSSSDESEPFRAKPDLAKERSSLSGGDMAPSSPDEPEAFRAKPDLTEGLRAKPPLSRGGVVSSPSEAYSASQTPNSPPRSDFDLAFFFVLDGFTSLEPFGTNPQYIHFLQGKAARLLKGFAGADIALTAPFPEIAPFSACLALTAPDQTYDWEVRAALESWAVARKEPLRAEPEELRAKPPLSRGGDMAARNEPLRAEPEPLRAQPDLAEERSPLSRGGDMAATAIGLAIGERQRYRGCVLTFTTGQSFPQRLADRRFESSLIAGRAWRL